VRSPYATAGGPDVGVEVPSTGVEVAVGLEVALGAGLEVGVGLGDAEAVGVAVAVAVGVGLAVGVSASSPAQAIDAASRTVMNEVASVRVSFVISR
jgi:hypothetical protein